jgi:hypothetical protein
MKWDGTTTNVPASVEYFSDPGGDVEFSKREGEPAKFRIHLYTGAAMPHWYFGKIVVDTSGIKLAKGKPVMVLREHMTGQVVGAGYAKKKDGSLWIEDGVFYDTHHGREVMSTLHNPDLAAPWQASMRLSNQEVQELGEKESDEVNGVKLKGPAIIIRKSTLREGSFCVAGMDGATSGIAASEESEVVEIDIVKPESQEEETMTMENITPDAETQTETAGAISPEVTELKAKLEQAESVAKERADKIKELQAREMELGIEAWARDVQDDKKCFSDEALTDLTDTLRKMETGEFANGETAASLFRAAIERYVPKRSDGVAPVGFTAGEGDGDAELRKEYEDWKAKYALQDGEETMSFEEFKNIS